MIVCPSQCYREGPSRDAATNERTGYLSSSDDQTDKFLSTASAGSHSPPRMPQAYLRIAAQAYRAQSVEAGSFIVRLLVEGAEMLCLCSPCSIHALRLPYYLTISASNPVRGGSCVSPASVTKCSDRRAAVQRSSLCRPRA